MNELEVLVNQYKNIDSKLDKISDKGEKLSTETVVQRLDIDHLKAEVVLLKKQQDEILARIDELEDLPNKEKAIVLKEDKFNKANVSKIIEKMLSHYDYAVSLNKKYNWNVPVKIYADYNEESITKELMIKYKVPAFNCYKYDKAYAIEK